MLSQRWRLIKKYEENISTIPTEKKSALPIANHEDKQYNPNLSLKEIRSVKNVQVWRKEGKTRDTELSVQEKMTEPENKSVLLGNNSVTMFGNTPSKRAPPDTLDKDNDSQPDRKRPRT